MLENLIKTMARRFRENQEREQAAQAEPVTQLEAPFDTPAYFTVLNLEVRKGDDGSWTVLNKEWNCQSTQRDPEKALLLMWRYIYQQGQAAMQAGKSQ